MKVSRDNQPPGKIDYSNPLYVWEILEPTGWEYGASEGGSSGSPLFDDEGRIIGQLYGGSSECVGLTDNGAADIYGRVDKSWDGAGSSSTRLSDWLDPNGTGQTVLNAYPAISDDDLAILLSMSLLLEIYLILRIFLLLFKIMVIILLLILRFPTRLMEVLQSPKHILEQ